MKRGFTLVELLAVILILAVLAIASGVAIFGVINDSRSKLLEEQKKGALDAAVTYFVRSKRYMSSCGSEPSSSSYDCAGRGALRCSCTISIENLKTGGYFDNKNNICSGNVIVYKIDGELKAKFASEDVCAYK